MKRFVESIWVFLRGLLMGTADAIPGVSGGTIALITGIYERLIHAINGVNYLLVKEFFAGRFKKFFINFKKVDFALFIPLLLGIVLAVFTFAHLMSYLLVSWARLTYAFFFGLILSSSFFVYKHAGKRNFNNVLFLILGLLFALWFSGLEAFQSNNSLLVIFLSGAIAICAMILPGISGAFILVLLGKYEFLVGELKNLVFSSIFSFVLGGVIGLLSFSKLLDYLLRTKKGVTMSFLTGLMVGSLRIPVEKVIVSNQNFYFVLLMVVFGFVLVFFLEEKFAS